MWVVQAYSTWLTRNWIFKLAFCNSNLCVVDAGARSFYFLTFHFTLRYCPSVCLLCSKKELFDFISLFPSHFILTARHAWWIFVAQKPPPIWTLVLHFIVAIVVVVCVTHPDHFEHFLGLNVCYRLLCTFAFAMRQRPTDWAFQIYHIHYIWFTLYPCLLIFRIPFFSLHLQLANTSI